MPTSTTIFKNETIDFIKNKFNPNSSILDIGVGCGTYSNLLRNRYPNIDGIEIFTPYIDMFKLKDKYRNLYNGDVLGVKFNYYNLIILGDVLEHITESEGIKLISEIYDKCDDMVISVPFNSKQGIHYNNVYEIHKQDSLNNEKFLQLYKGFKLFCLRYDFGVYIKDIPSNKNSKIYVDDVNLDFNHIKSSIETRYPNSTIIKYNETGAITPTIKNNELTVVSGLWNIGRSDRPFHHYIDAFKKFLDIPNHLFVYIPKEYEYLVWEKRKPENTHVKLWELNDIKELYKPFWDKTQKIRNNPQWYNITGENGWLKNSPQALLEWYNPIVQSKYSMLNNATIWNPFNSKFFFWVDAGITNTVPYDHLVNHNVLSHLPKYTDPFLFLSYPYNADKEIHGFDIKGMNKYSGDIVKYVCRGGLFGGEKQQINEANGLYYSLLDKTLTEGYMGTEESIFTIMSYLYPNIHKRFELDGNGLISKFTQYVIDDNPPFKNGNKSIESKIILKDNPNDYKTNLYVLTFNFPDQVLHTIRSMEKTPEWLKKPRLILLDNSTNQDAISGNKELSEKYNFEHIHLGKNTGICGGRQYAAEHFHESTSDFMFFFEDDMCINSNEMNGQFCRNGFRKYIPNLYNTLHRIMVKESFDFLKLSFTEVYFDNDKSLPWYNVPQHIRTRDWPDYDRLPITGIDKNSPPADYKHIKVMDGVSYVTGDINYCNWPMIVSKEGNKKMFIDTKWDHPYEQTWSSHIYQLTKQGKIHSGLLLASPIWHQRIKHYKPEERREN